MRFRARRGGPHFYVDAIIQSPIIPQSVTTFLLDTGCSVTTLLPFDVNRFNLPWRRLIQDGPVQTGQGHIQPRQLSDVTIRVRGETGLFNLEKVWISQHFPYIHIMDPTFQCDPYSLLGMDFLLNFNKWEVHENYVVIET